ncbi:dipeptide ABC transporter ATP-binding protein [Promicromonospora sp. NPDC023805]|uniref:dipeptide ABC transporter ATP-binding protein n=1 Tax=Promicromonospora sp. NPDC023805 TaxID=3154696 RepID=UPI0033C4C511
MTGPARRARVHPQLAIGAVLVGLVVVTALVSLVWTPYDPEHAGAERLLPPGAEHWLGTDRFGRDVLSQVMAGAQVTLLVGLVAVGIAAVVGVPLGVLAGMRGGRLGALLMRGSDILLAFPGLLLAIVLGAVYGAGTVTAMVALGIGSIPAFARVARGGTLQVVRSDYVLAARAANRGELAIAARHVLPNIGGMVMVQCSVNFATAVLAEAGLSFLGLGTPPPTPSWGRMLQESQQFLGVADHLAIVPGVAIAVAVLGFNLLGDGLRDVFDPRLSAVAPQARAVEPNPVVEPDTLVEPVETPQPPGDPQQPAALDIHDLTVRTNSGRPLLSHVSLRVGPGERVGLIGESGSGKTMTALAALGLLPDGVAATGQVRLAGVPGNLLDRGEQAMARLRGEALSMVFQEPMTALNPLMRVGRQVAEAMTLHGTTSRTATRRAAELLAEVGLPGGAARRYPHELSGGQRQRVGLAMALANDPAVLVADEPTTALDVTVQRQVLDLMVRLVEDRGAGLLFITHDLAVVSQVCERVVVLLEGVVVEEGPVAEVFAHPRHEYTKRLLAASALEPRLPAAPRETREPLIRVADVTRTYPSRGEVVHALRGVSLEVQEGQRFGIVGESGSGKSTLLRIVAGLDRPTSGHVTSAGVRIGADGVSTGSTSGAGAPGLGDLRAALQVVFQDPYSSLDPRMTVGDIVAEPLLNPANVRAGGPRTALARRDAVREMLDAVGLPLDATERYPHQFSGGQRQRIAIARALVCRPRILVADEPVSALDVSVRRQVLDLLARLADEHALTLLLVSHDLGVVRHVCDHVAVMRDGLIVEQGPTDQVYDTPHHEYTRRLRDATPLLLF